MELNKTSYAKKYLSIKKNREFQFLFKKGTSIVSFAFICYVRKNNRRSNRLGVVTSKKIGNAVKRNRARRVIRAAFMQLEPEQRKKSDNRYDFIFVARAKTTELKTQKVIGVMKNKVFEALPK